jgi:hypothetical protein
MGDIIDFKSHKIIEVELEDNDYKGQMLLTISIVSLWSSFGGELIRQLIPEEDHELYLTLFLQFSDLCYWFMQEGEIIVSEDNEIALSKESKEKLIDVIKSIKREFAGNNNTTH